MTTLPAVTPHDAVVLFRTRDHLPDHEGVVHEDIARRIARLMDIPFDGQFDPARHIGKRCYLVPSDALAGAPLRKSLGVGDESDLFGGYVPEAFMATKAITHSVVGSAAKRPTGWSEAFSDQVRSAVLPGHTAFTLADLHEAAQRLMKTGNAVRLKPVLGTAGRGQVCVRTPGDLDAALAGLEPEALARYGMVLETHLEDVVTYSVGQTRLPGLTASYIGTQSITHDNDGEPVYGGSQLRFTRGGYAALLQMPMEEDFRQAVELARRYDAAADTCYPGFFASRRNYDVAAGVDGNGRRLMGVLEQSWRVGGASRAEIAALEIFAADPACQYLQAETIERFGPDAAVPPDAIETYADHDPDLGLIRKYVRVEAYGNKQ